MSKIQKKICTILNYIEHVPILASAVIGSASVSVFASLVGIPIEIASSAVVIKVYAIAAIIKKYM